MNRKIDGNPVNQKPYGILPFLNSDRIFLELLCLFLIVLVVSLMAISVFPPDSPSPAFRNGEDNPLTVESSHASVGNITDRGMPKNNPIPITVPFRDLNSGGEAIINMYQSHIILPDGTYLEFRNGGYYCRVGRVWMTAKPLDNYGITGLGMQKNGIVVTGIVWKNRPVVYRYDLGFMDWNTWECDNPWDESTCHMHTAYAKDSTIDISQAGGGPISVRVNGDSVIILQSPPPVIDATGTGRSVKYILDVKNRTISLSLYGNLTDLEYPLSFTMSV